MLSASLNKTFPSFQNNTELTGLQTNRETQLLFRLSPVTSDYLRLPPTDHYEQTRYQQRRQSHACRSFIAGKKRRRYPWRDFPLNVITATRQTKRVIDIHDNTLLQVNAMMDTCALFGLFRDSSVLRVPALSSAMADEKTTG